MAIFTCADRQQHRDWLCGPKKRAPERRSPARYGERTCEDGSVNGPFVVILGDSITQNARLPETVCGMPLINAGTGGSRASTYIRFAEEMRAQKISPSLVVIALGTNDAISGYGTDFIPAYELLILSLPASSLAFATPPPSMGQVQAY
jgi:hypothetical protein